MSEKNDIREPAKTGRNQDGTFAKGHSGNKAGRARGSRNQATVLAQSMLDGQAEELVQAAIEMALSGDQQMLRLCVERLVPPRKDSPVKYRMPTIKAPEDAIKAAATIVNAVSKGTLTPSEGELLGKATERYVRAVEVHEIVKRLERLEQELQR